jgi:hypothetical protein
MERPVTSTRSSRILRVSFLLCGLTGGGAVSAAGWEFVDSMPATHFNKEDRDLMRKNATEVLESTDPKASAEWMNPNTGNEGSATFRGQFTATDGAPCKRLWIANSAKKGTVKNAAMYTLCKYEGRGWLQHPDAVPAPPTPK